MEAVKSFSRPTANRQVHAFQGVAGYYRCSMPLNFSPVLSNLTRKEQSRKIVEPVKVEALITEPFLHIGSMTLPTEDDVSPWSHCSGRQGLKIGWYHRKILRHRKRVPFVNINVKIFIKSKNNI